MQNVGVYAGATLESILMTEKHHGGPPGRPVSA